MIFMRAKVGDVWLYKAFEFYAVFHCLGNKLA